MRIGVFIVAALWLTPVIAVGGVGLGMAPMTAVLCGAVIAGVLAWITSKPLARTLAVALVGRPVLTAAAILVAAVAITLIARESVFMADSTQPRYSLIPGDPWRVGHSCMSGYFEAARFVQAGSDNIYDRGLYQPRQIGALNVDSYHYPPPFLLVPQALRLITTDFFQLRALWFATQALVLGSVVAALGVWIGEVLGAYTLIGGLFFLSAPTVIYSLQMGNFQSTAMALGVLALICLVTRRILVGAFILAYAAISKIFPGLLVVYLLFARRWQAVGWTAGAGLILLALSIGVLGTQPMKDFVHYELPAISDGSAFPQSERLNVAQSNQSMYGLTVRVRHLGATWLDQRTGLRAASLYGLLILGLTAFAGWRSRINLTSPAGRALLVQTSLALMTLASFRSPFVGGPYGLVSTMWLLTLLVATAPTRLYSILWALAFGVCALGNLLTPSPTYPPTTFWLIASGAIVIAAMAMSVWVVVRPILGANPPSSLGDDDNAAGRSLASA
jgi:alpha-1,2-mannosyltransferase